MLFKKYMKYITTLHKHNYKLLKSKIVYLNSSSTSGEKFNKLLI